MDSCCSFTVKQYLYGGLVAHVCTSSAWEAEADDSRVTRYGGLLLKPQHYKDRSRRITAGLMTVWSTYLSSSTD